MKVIFNPPQGMNIDIQLSTNANPASFNLVEGRCNDQSEFVTMGRCGRSQVRVAGRLCGLQCQRVGDPRRDSVHTESGRASQENGFWCGVRCVVEETWSRV